MYARAELLGGSGPAGGENSAGASASSVAEDAPRRLVTPDAGLIEQIQVVPFTPAPEALLIDHDRPQEAPSEEFRSLRTRLNHLQTLQPIHTVVVTSPSPAEGKSFAAPTSPSRNRIWRATWFCWWTSTSAAPSYTTCFKSSARRRYRLPARQRAAGGLPEAGGGHQPVSS